MGKFKEPVWVGLNAQDLVVRDCFPHLWMTHPRGDICENVAYPAEPVTICAHCFVERCLAADQASRCLLPSGHTREVTHINERNHRWPAAG